MKKILNNNGIIMYEIIIQLLPEEYKAMSTNCYSVEEWIINVIKEKARRTLDEFIINSGLGSKNTILTKKLEIINQLNIEINEKTINKVIDPIKHQIIIQLLPEEYKVLWNNNHLIENEITDIIKIKINKVINKLIINSGKGSQYTNKEKKLEIIRNLKIKTAKEKTNEFEIKIHNLMKQ